MKRTLLVLIALLVVFPAVAEEKTIREYLKLFDGEKRGEVLMELHSMGAGFLWANMSLESQKRRPLFCLQNKKAGEINGEWYLSILRSAIELNKSILDDPGYSRGFHILGGLIRTYPCLSG